MTLNTPKLALPLLIIIYLVIGFFAPNPLIEFYFHGKHLIVEDAGEFMRKPIINAFVFAVGIGFFYFFFTIVNPYNSLRKEMIFHAKFLLTNTVLLCSILYLLSFYDVRLNKLVTTVAFDHVNFYPYYILSTLMSCIIFFFIRSDEYDKDKK